MIKISAFAQDKKPSIPMMGRMEKITSIKGTSIILRKRVKTKGLKKYIKAKSSPMYTKKTLFTSFSGAEVATFTRKIAGVVGNRTKATPAGYIVLKTDDDNFSVPVYPLAAYPSAFHHICGYLVTDEGYVAVAKRKTIFWALIGFMTSFAVMISLFIYRFGAEITLLELMALLGIG